jgi:hypothetical protein
VGVGHATGDIFVDPVLEIENAEVETSFAAVSYVHSFGLLGKSARFDVALPYATGRWTGERNGDFLQAERQGFRDPRLRFSMLLYGGPALGRAEFAKAEMSSTVVGVGLAVSPPLGEYFEDKRINLGDNRWTLHPQLGVTHTRGPWSYELTGSVFLYTDNDDFLNDQTLSNDPLYALQGHLVYTFRPGLWISAGSAYGSGAEPSINGVSRGVKTTNWLNALSVGLPISRTQGLKFTVLSTQTQEENGVDLTTVLLGYSKMF